MSFVSGCCKGEICAFHDCVEPAAAKVEETIFHDDPMPVRHPLTAYLCEDHFLKIMGKSGVDWVEEHRPKASPMPSETGSVRRRSRIDLFTPAERAIFDAHQAVEAMPADVRLTNAGTKLSEARALVADFVDGVQIGEGYPRPAGVVCGACSLTRGTVDGTGLCISCRAMREMLAAEAARGPGAADCASQNGQGVRCSFLEGHNTLHSWERCEECDGFGHAVDCSRHPRHAAKVHANGTPPLRHTVAGVLCVTIPATVYDALKAGPSSGLAARYETACALLARAHGILEMDPKLTKLPGDIAYFLWETPFTSPDGGK